MRKRDNNNIKMLATHDRDTLDKLASDLARLPNLADEALSERLAHSLVNRLSGIDKQQIVHPVKKSKVRVNKLVVASFGTAALIAVSLIFVSTANQPRELSQSSVRMVLAQTINAETGHSLQGVSFHELVTSYPPPGSHTSGSVPVIVDEQVEIAGSSHWRILERTSSASMAVQHILWVRAGSTGWRENLTNKQSYLETSSSFPNAFSNGLTLDPTALLSRNVGQCARSVKLNQHGPVTAGRATELLELGPSPCPSADVPGSAGPASFVIDSKTHLILSSRLHFSSGQLSEQLQVSSLQTGISFPASNFPSSPPAGTIVPVATVGPVSSISQLQAEAAFDPFVPQFLPRGWHLGLIKSPSGPVLGGKVNTFTLFYVDSEGATVLEVDELLGGGTFPAGSKVILANGTSATLTSNGTPNGDASLWFVANGVHIMISQGTTAFGIHVSATVSVATLVNIAGSFQPAIK